MPRPLAISLGALVLLGACGKPKPLSLPPDGAPGGPSAPDEGSADSQGTSPKSDNVSVDTAASESIRDAATEPAAGDALTVDATRESPDLVLVDGGHVPYRAIAVATGEIHTCALLDDHRVKCWGDNSSGQLGYEDMRTRGNSPSEMGDSLPTVDLGSGRTATAIAASRYTSCAILDDGSMKCWGWRGLVGRVSTNNIGDEPGEMGDHLPALDFGGRKAVNLAMGEYDACASMDDDTIWCWGESGGTDPTPRQQKGLPAKRVRALGPSFGGVIALYDDGTISLTLPVGSFVMLTPGHKVVAVAGGVGTGTCLLLDDATTTCVGGNTPFDGPAHAIAIGVERIGGLCSVLSDGFIWCHAQNCIQRTYYKCTTDGSVDLGVPAVAVTSNGSDFACALLVDGNIKCWSGTDATIPPAPWLGAAIDFTQTSGGITYGAWRTVDLGTHP
jgi:hypothetical protein